ncbi:MAG: hypothetical protein AAGF54_13360 [Pseudomonadota bacterium]
MYLKKLIIAFVTLQLTAGNWFVTNDAMAASSSVNFTGHVSNSDLGTTSLFPRIIVSFSDEAALPVPGYFENPMAVTVYQGSQMQLVSSGYFSRFEAGRSNQHYRIVKLNSSGMQEFTLCASGQKNCLRYQVLRND